MEPRQLDLKTMHSPLGISGLGGWLVVVQIYLYLSFFSMIALFYQNILPILLDPTSLDLLIVEGSESYHPYWLPMIMFDIAMSVLFIFYFIYVFISLYRKKAIFPKLMIVLYAVGLAINVIDYFLMAQIPQISDTLTGSMRDILKQAIGCAIWIPYYIKSVRVKNTFVR